MSVAPLPTARSREERLLGVPARARRAPDARAIARRRLLITITKWVLPLSATALLTAIVVWPQIQHLAEAGRVAFHRMTGGVEGGQLVDPRYRGVDERGRPYMLTAATAQQVSPERVNLVTPKADVTLESGAWLMLQSDNGVYIQHTGELDLSGHVVLYRDDGVTVRTRTADVDLKQGAAAGNDTVSAEGPFGTLDAMGFATVDKGAVLQFTGPARLYLNSTRS